METCELPVSAETTNPRKKPPRQRMTVRRQIKRLAVLLALIAAFFADRILFPAPPASYSDTDQTIKLRAADGTLLSAMHFQNPRARYTILYSHGNGEDLGQIAYAYEMIRSAGFNVFAYDYRGYGTSQGTATEENCCADIEAVYQYVIKDLGVPADRILLLGRSVGGGPSVDLAARKPVGGLILESSFVSAFRAATRVPLLPWDKFRNLDKMPAVKCPVLVIHGQQDWTIGSWHGKRLYEAATGPKQCLWVEKAGHNDVVAVAGRQYLTALKSFAAMIDSSSPQPGTQP